MDQIGRNGSKSNKMDGSGKKWTKWTKEPKQIELDYNANVTQLERGNNKCYVLAFRYFIDVRTF